MEDKSFLKRDLFKRIRELENIMDQVRDHGIDAQISFPRIVVLGAPSSGKSSLLENIIGMDFLPKGYGIVTRRPLELRLIHINHKDLDGKAYAVFEGDNTNKKYTDFSEVRQNIQNLTDKVAGFPGKVVDTPIKLRIYSVEYPNLTLIDLPGINRIIHSPSDLQAVTTDINKCYCTDPKTIILCVIPGNQDLRTSNDLKLIKQWDPEGQRTIGVITKIDIMDRGTDAKKTLMNEEVPLRHGYIGVVNRTFQDIRNKVPIGVGLKNEAKFFHSHRKYRDLPRMVLGTKALRNKLSDLLVENIKRSLLITIQQYEGKINEAKEKIDYLGVPSLILSGKKCDILILITDFLNDFEKSLSERYAPHAQNNSEEIEKGAEIKGKFRSICKDFTEKQKLKENYEDDFILGYLKSYQEGNQISRFPSMQCLRSLLVPQITQLKGLAYTEFKQIYQEILQLASKLNRKVFDRFPMLIQIINGIIIKKLNELREQTQSTLDTLIEEQICVAFADDTYLSTKYGLLVKAAKQRQSDAKKLLVSEIREILDNQLIKIIVQVLNDGVSKMIGQFSKKRSQEILKILIFHELSNLQIWQNLRELEETEKQRKRLSLNIQTLQKSIQHLQQTFLSFS